MSTIIHAIVGYLFLLFIVRILTRRPGAQLTQFEFVVVFLIGGIIILATVGKDRSVTNCGTAIIAVTMMHRLVTLIKMRSAFWGRIIDGTPVVLLKNGEWQRDVMENVHIAEDDVMAVARSKGIRSLTQVKYAILERNGSISIFKK